MISILNYGLGNIASISNMISYVGGRFEVIDSCDQIIQSKKLILPGVGHFDNGMSNLHSCALVDPLREAVFVRKTPLLGICLGMQLLCNKSEEGEVRGLGFVDAEVVKFRFGVTSVLKIPHMGWNSVSSMRDNPLIQLTHEQQRFYFVHSYHVVPSDECIAIASANYGYDFCAAFQKDNIYGVQFHPEKSHRFGMALMKRFMEL